MTSERGGPHAVRAGAILGPLLFAVCYFWPGSGLSPAQRGALAATVLTATLWLTSAIPIGAASLIPGALFPLLGVIPAGELAPAYMHDLVFLFLGAFVIALGLERWDLHRRIALAIVHRVGASPRRVVLGFMIAAAFLSMWISNTATTLVMLPIGMAVIATLEPNAGEGETRFSIALFLGIAYAASIGGVGTLVGTASNMAFRSLVVETFPEAPAIGFGVWMRDWLPLVLVFVPIAWLLLTRVLSPVGDGERDAQDVIERARARQGPMTRPQLCMAVIFVLTALLWITRADLDLGVLRIPGWVRLFLASGESYAEHQRDISDGTVAVLIACVMFAIPVRDPVKRERTFLMDWNTAKKLPWDVVLLIGGGLCIARGFQSTGLAVVVGEGLAPMIEGRSIWLIVLATALFVSFLTEVTSNTATTFVLLPVLAQSAVAAGINPLIVMLPATVAASLAFMLPVATPPNAVVFSSRRVSIPSMARVGFWLNLTGVLLLTLVFQLWVRPLLGIATELPTWAKP